MKAILADKAGKKPLSSPRLPAIYQESAEKLAISAAC
jgi:hypothetical protein